MSIDPARARADLAELDRLAGDRPAWSHDWQRAGEWLREKAREAGASSELDKAGNEWFTVRGATDETVALGGHLDTGAGPGGALSLLCGLEVLRHAAESGSRPTITLVSWADGAGARFGRPFGASAAAGTMRDWFVASELVDAGGAPLLEIVQSLGVEPRFAHMARRQLLRAGSYLELATEPDAVGPGSAWVVTGTSGTERCRLSWESTAGGEVALAAAERFPGALAARLTGKGSTGSARAVVEEERVSARQGVAVHLFDAHAADPAELTRLLELALDAADEIAEAAEATVEWQRLWRTAPVEFDPGLVAAAVAAVRAVTGEATERRTDIQTSASEVARGGGRAALVIVGTERGGVLAPASVEAESGSSITRRRTPFGPNERLLHRGCDVSLPGATLG